MSAARQQHAPGPGPTRKAHAETMQKLSEQALRFLPPGRIEATMRQWLMQASPGLTREDQLHLHSEATVLARDVLLCVPSANGATAFDRLARHCTDLSPAERTALTLLRRARHRVARIGPAAGPGRCTLQDLASHETISIPLDDLPPAAAGAVILGRIAALGDGTHVLIGPAMPLNEAALNVARAFIRTGATALINPVRCAEAVYRHVLRHGTVIIPGLNGPVGKVTEADPIDTMAAAWSRLAADAEPDDAQLREIRATALPDHLIYALRGAVIAREAGIGRLAEGYVRVARVIIETMSLRSAVGSAKTGIDAATAAIADLIAQRRAPPESLPCSIRCSRAHVRRRRARPRMTRASNDWSSASAPCAPRPWNKAARRRRHSPPQRKLLNYWIGTA